MTREEAIALVNKLGSHFGFCKIGWANRANKEIDLSQEYYVMDLRTETFIRK